MQTEATIKEVLDVLGITFKWVKFKNFMSFGNVFTTVNLETPGTTLLVGENLDNGGSSGAGKSTLINAISYCLYDKIPSSVTKDKLINRTNEKKNTLMEVDLCFTKGDDEFIVRRWRGSSTGVQLLINEEDKTPASVNRGEDSFNARIEELLGFSYNLFAQIILFNGNSQPFLDLSVGAQRQLIEELFRITILTRKANALKKQSSETDKSISMQKLLITQQEKQKETRRKHVADAANRVTKWDADRAIELDRIQRQLEASTAIDFDTEETIHGEISSLKADVQSWQLKVREIQTNLNSKKAERFPKSAQITIANNDVSKLNRDLEKGEKELVHLRDAKCPYCLQQFENAAAKIEEMTKNQASIYTNIGDINHKLTELTAEQRDFDSIQSDLISVFEEDLRNAKKEQESAEASLHEILDTLHYKDLTTLLKAKNDIVLLHERLEKMVVETNPHTEAYESLIAEGEVVVDVAELDKLTVLYTHQQFLLKLLTDKNSFIRKGIISKTIPFLNKRIAYYTEKLNLPHIVLFQADMSCEITQIGRELDHGNLSNGEKKKLNLSLCLSFRDVLTYLHSKVNVLFTDEIDGGSISGLDVDSLIGMIKSKAWDDEISIFIISHRPEFDGRCDRNLVIRKEGGFSSLIEQPDA